MSEYYPEIKKAYLLGMNGLRDVLRNHGIDIIGGEDDKDKTLSICDWDNFTYDDSLQAVIGGLDFNFNYYKTLYASALLQVN
jgi:ribonucleotide monophosphatase NagD (HAD superfamily)